MARSPRPAPTRRPLPPRVEGDHVPEPHPALARAVGAPLTILVAMHVLDKVEQGHEAAYVLSRAARGAMLPPEQRARPVELVHGALRSLNRLDHAVNLAVKGETQDLEAWRRQYLRVAALLGERNEPVLAMLPWAGLMARFPDRRRAAERQAEAAATHAQAFLRQAPSRDVKGLALATGHPEWFVAVAQDRLGARAVDLLRANNEDPPLVLRVNTLKVTREEVVEALRREGFTARPTRHSPVGIIAEPKEGAFRTRAFKAGFFEAQDEGSQLLGFLVGAKPGEWVLDACAGAGGKTLLLAAEMRNKGRLLTIDTHAGRLLELKRRCARAGAENYEAFVLDAQGEVLGGAKALRRGDDGAVPKLPKRDFDRILVDAPCSGLGTLRRTPELRWRHTAETLATYPERQRAILDTWAPRVKPGGRLVYGTCTILPAENEAVVAGFLTAHPDFHMVPAGEAFGARLAPEGLADSQGYLRLWPHTHGTEGFFAAVLQRSA